MDVLIQFDQEGLYQNNPWDIPIPYRKGAVLSVNPLSAMVLIDQNQAHLYDDNSELRMNLES